MKPDSDPGVVISFVQSFSSQDVQISFLVLLFTASLTAVLAAAFRPKISPSKQEAVSLILRICWLLPSALLLLGGELGGLLWRLDEPSGLSYKPDTFLLTVRYCCGLIQEHPLTSNGITYFLVLGLVYFIWHAAGIEYWAMAWRQIRRRKLGMICLFILLLYCGVGILDSFSWQVPLYEEDNVTFRKDTAERMIYDPKTRTALDRLMSYEQLGNLPGKDEKSYSAPGADYLLMNITVPDGKGGMMFTKEKLKYQGQHPLGTDKTGQDVLYRSIKAIRTGLLIGIVPTLLATPLAILIGLSAGYFGGWVDDLIQYFYTTLACLPSVLLMIAFMLIFEQGIIQLCIIMGITSWVSLCRLLRGETLKLRELDYVQASRAQGAGAMWIIMRHLAPNVMHIVLISFILRFSGLVLAEAILTYIGVGVGENTVSWGKMIDSARFELARDPAVWWNLGGAFIFMLVLVLSANLFGDAVRDALDPKLKKA